MTSLERLALEIVVGFFLIGSFALYERHKGAQKCVAADVSAVQKQETANAVSAALAAKEVNDEVSHYNATVIAPITAPVVRVCRYTPAAMPTAAPTGSQVHAEAPNGTADPGRLVEGPDIGKPLVMIGRDADALLDGLQQYVAKVCLAPKGQPAF